MHFVYLSDDGAVGSHDVQKTSGLSVPFQKNLRCTNICDGRGRGFAAAPVFLLEFPSVNSPGLISCRLLSTVLQQLKCGEVNAFSMTLAAFAYFDVMCERASPAA